jgi:hypothetical protein
MRPEDLLPELPFVADRYDRREYALVDGASFSNQTNPLQFGLWNKSNDFAHFRTTPERALYEMSNVMPSRRST